MVKFKSPKWNIWEPEGTWESGESKPEFQVLTMHFQLNVSAALDFIALYGFCVENNDLVTLQNWVYEMKVPVCILNIYDGKMKTAIEDEPENYEIYDCS